MTENNNNIPCRSALMKTIQIYSFAMKDLQLYLDTHPKCFNALALFKKYKMLWEKAVAQYNECYGPLTPEQSECTTEWNWTKSPWPWERSDC